MSRKDFIVSFILFVFAICYSLLGIIMVGNNELFSIKEIVGFFILIPPLLLLMSGILDLGLLIWNLYINKLEK